MGTVGLLDGNVEEGATLGLLEERDGMEDGDRVGMKVGTRDIATGS